MSTRAWIAFVYSLLIWTIVLIGWETSPGPCGVPDVHHHVRCAR